LQLAFNLLLFAKKSSLRKSAVGSISLEHGLDAAEGKPNIKVTGSCGLVPVIQLFDLPALNQSFVYALECRHTGNAFAKHTDCHHDCGIAMVNGDMGAQVTGDYLLGNL